MSTATSARLIYLDAEGESVCTYFHSPAAAHARDTAVVLCPPFGWDEVCSYRSRREWAQSLAAAGYPCSRLSYPSTGDSSGCARDPRRLDAWTAAVRCTAELVRAASGASRAVAIGIGLGGLVAYRAAATGAPLDDLVLWATPGRARAILRQLRAFSGLEVSQFFHGLEPPPPLPPGELEAGGFLLSASTVDELGELDLTSLPLSDPSDRHVLLLERDGIAVDQALHESLVGQGISVTVAPGEGYAAMSSHPQLATPPTQLIEHVMTWLDGFSAPAATSAEVSPRPVGAADSAQIQVGDTVVTESAVTVQQSFGTIEGILATLPHASVPGLCAVLLNAGAVRRIGPSRMWVEAARRWAANGIPTLRLDVEGIGDADGDASPYAADAGLYVPELVPQVLASLDVLQDRDVGERFVLGGLCAGAYWAFHAALEDERVVAALMVNPRALIWDLDLAPSRDFRKLMTESLTFAKIREQASIERTRAIARWMLATPNRKLSESRARRAGLSTTADEVDAALDRFHASGKRGLLLFADDEPLHGELARSGALARIEGWENVTIEYVHVRDHTLRPNWAQRQLHDALDRELQINATPSRAAR